MPEQHQHDRQERSLTDAFSELIADGTLDPVIDHLPDGVAQEVQTVKLALDNQLLAVEYARATRMQTSLARAAELALDQANVKLEQSSRQLALARYTTRKRLSSSE